MAEDGFGNLCELTRLDKKNWCLLQTQDQKIPKAVLASIVIK